MWAKALTEMPRPQRNGTRQVFIFGKTIYAHDEEQAKINATGMDDCLVTSCKHTIFAKGISTYIGAQGDSSQYLQHGRSRGN